MPASVWEPGIILSFRYKIISHIAKGGNGVVCLARDLIEDETRVLKIFRSENQTHDTLGSFFQESQNARHFIHPNIVRTYGGGLDGTVFYIVQDWICGIDLLNYEYQIGSLTLSQVCYITLKICDAMAFIWENFRVLHRDIKPENILIDKDGEILYRHLGTIKPDDLKKVIMDELTPYFQPRK